MNRGRTIASVFALVLLSVLAQAAVAHAEFRGSDMWSNLMPGDGGQGLANRYPLSHYQLDYYVDDGALGFGQIPAQIAQFFASQIFALAVIAMRFVIAIFDWSSNLDLITGDKGALALSSPVVQQNYEVVVRPFMATAFICFGVWIAYKVLKRENKDAGSALIRVIALSVLAIAIFAYPSDTIGRAYEMGDEISAAIISRGGSYQDVSDRMFMTNIYRPAAVLQHGGLQVCTGAKTDGDGFPLAATGANPPKTCHSVLKKDPDGHGDYARRFFRYAPGSQERKAEYDALREGEAPPTAQFADVKIDRTDAPAVDMMQAGGALQRLVFVLLILCGMAGSILLLGLIILARLFSQVALMILYQLSPFMILAAAYPGLHGVCLKWAKWVGKALVSTIVYAILLAITLSTSDGLMLIGGQSGFLVAFALQSLVYAGVFWKRKEIFAKLTSSKAAERYSESEHQSVAFVSGAATAAVGAVSGGAGYLAQSMREGWSGSGWLNKDQSNGASSTPDSTSPPALAGRDHSPAPASTSEGQSATAPTSSSTSDTLPESVQPAAQQQGTEQGEITMPTKPFSEDLANARAQRYDDEDKPPGEAPKRPDPPGVQAPEPLFNGIASASTFREDLERERHEQELARRE